MPKPKSWKDQVRKPVKKTPPPIIHQPLPQGLTPEQIAASKAARKAALAISDAWRCPICGAQIETSECVADPYHYQCSFDKNSKPTYQGLRLLSDVDGYFIACTRRDDDQYNCIVYHLDVSFPEPLRTRYKTQVASFVADVSPYWCASYDVFVKKVELLQLLS